MTRQEVLDYIIETHGDALTAAGIAHADDPTSLYYVLYDAMLYEDVGDGREDVGDGRQMNVADAKVAQLIADKAAAREEQLLLEEALRAKAEALRIEQERAANEEALRIEQERAANEEALRIERALPEDSPPDARQIRFKNRVMAQAEQPERVLVDPRAVEE
jgi:hypothetical protein